MKNNSSSSLLKIRFGVMALLVCFTVGLAIPQQALSASKPKPSTVAAQSALELPAPVTEIGPHVDAILGKSTLVRLPAPVVRISVGNPSVADVVLINPREVYLLGKSIGSTNVILWGKSGQATIVDVAVAMDTAALQNRLNLLLPNEKNIMVSASADTVVLSGRVSNAVKASQAVELAEAYSTALMAASAGASSQAGGNGATSKTVNLLQLNDPQQVMLEVKIAEINRTLAEKLGFDFARQFTTGGGAWTKTVSGIFGGGAAKYNRNYNATQKIGAGDLTVGGTLDSPLTLPIQVPQGIPGVINATTPAGAATSIDLINSTLQQTPTNMSQDFTSWLVDAEKKDGLVKILAEPNIVALSGQEGSFLAGGEIMIPVQQSAGVTTLSSKQFGVGLRFTPTVLEDGRIHIRVLPEVSDLVGFTSVSSTSLGASVLVPTLTTRRISTAVELREGQSLAIGGLLSDNFRESVNRFPILGEIPILGALFRSSEFQKNKTELLIVVTPRLVKPLAPDYALPTDNFKEPSRSEFFFGGKMEATPKDASQPEAPVAENKDETPAAGGFQMK